MSIKSNTIQSVLFQEHTILHFTSQEFNKNDTVKYCTELLDKVRSIPQFELKEFIDQQCTQVQTPFAWLNKLEELLTENAELFELPKMKGRFTKLYTLIEAKRHKLQCWSNCNQTATGQTFCFTTIQEKSKAIQNIEDKIAFLENAKTDFLQCDNPISNKHGKSFDEKIELEIERVQKLAIIQTSKIKNEATILNNDKFIINGNINILVNAFYQMMQEIKTNEKPYLSYSITDIANFICNNFIDKEGNSLSLNTIQTYLSPNKPHKRLKIDKSIRLYTKSNS